MDINDNEKRATQVIHVLDGLQFTDQIAVLIGTMLSFVVANCTDDNAKQVIANIAGLLPRQYQEARALIDAQQTLDAKLS